MFKAHQINASSIDLFLLPLDPWKSRVLDCAKRWERHQCQWRFRLRDSGSVSGWAGVRIPRAQNQASRARWKNTVRCLERNKEFFNLLLSRQYWVGTHMLNKKIFFVSADGHVPWMVRVYDRLRRGFICGGAIISTKHVITACSCYKVGRTIVL